MNAETLKDRPRIMYVCEVCAEGCPEACGYYDADEIRKAPGGEWLCIYCYEEYEHEDCETAPLFSDLPAAPELAADNVALQAEVERLRELLGKCVGILDATMEESGRSIEYGEEDPFRMGEWFEEDDMIAIEAARAALNETQERNDDQ